VAIDDHVRLLLAWNAAINLTAIREPPDIARLHVLDSLTAVQPLRDRGVREFLDLGSGAGFPGVPLALILPAERAALIDSVRKKAAFLGAAVGALGIEDRVLAIGARAEELARDPEHHERWQAVTARAVATLAELVELAFPLLEPGGWLVAWKRGDVESELAVARRAVTAIGGGSAEVLEPGIGELTGHRLVLVRKKRPTPARWPRDPACRRRNPW
jgi:16S rRNA (guanine527-N7)-methyltransferase